MTTSFSTVLHCRRNSTISACESVAWPHVLRYYPQCRNLLRICCIIILIWYIEMMYSAVSTAWWQLHSRSCCDIGVQRTSEYFEESLKLQLSICFFAGVLIFLRFFYIVGNAGVWQTFLIVFISFLCAMLTTMSLSAIATNGPIEEGGT